MLPAFYLTNVQMSNEEFHCHSSPYLRIILPFHCHCHSWFTTFSRRACAAPHEYPESRGAYHRKAISNRHHMVSRSTDFSGRRRNFDIDAFSSPSPTSAPSPSPSFPTEPHEFSPSPSTMPTTSPDAPNPSQGAVAQRPGFLEASWKHSIASVILWI